MHTFGSERAQNYARHPRNIDLRAPIYEPNTGLSAVQGGHCNNILFNIRTLFFFCKSYRDEARTFYLASRVGVLARNRRQKVRKVMFSFFEFLGKFLQLV